VAVKATNEAVDENGISPTYAVFGAHPRPIPALSKRLMPTTEDRIRSIESARRAIEKQKAAEAVKHARTATGPFPPENRFATRGGEKFPQFECVFEFANIRPIRILKMTGKFAEFEFKFQHRNSNSLWRIRIRIESCFQNSRIFAENSNSHYDSA
jgi:hypothetical protein